MTYQIENQNNFGENLNREVHDPSSVYNVCDEAVFPVEYFPALFMGGEYNTPIVPRVESGKNKGKPTNVFVVRTDTNQALGLHSSRYDQRQDGYATVLETAETLFPNSAESCTLFGNGERLVFTQTLGEQEDIGSGGDCLLPRLVWVSSLNGTWSTGVFNMMERPSCANQLIGATPLWKVKRTTNHGDRVEIRAEILANQVVEAKRFAYLANVMNDQTFTNREFDALVDKLVPLDWDASDRAFRNAETKQATLKHKWRIELDKWGSITSHGNRWLAYNAIQGAEQHYLCKGNAHALQQAVSGKTPLATKAMKLLAV